MKFVDRTSIDTLMREYSRVRSHIETGHQFFDEQKLAFQEAEEAMQRVLIAEENAEVAEEGARRAVSRSESVHQSLGEDLTLVTFNPEQYRLQRFYAAQESFFGAIKIAVVANWTLMRRLPQYFPRVEGPGASLEPWVTANRKLRNSDDDDLSIVEQAWEHSDFLVWAQPLFSRTWASANMGDGSFSIRFTGPAGLGGRIPNGASDEPGPLGQLGWTLWAPRRKPVREALVRVNEKQLAAAWKTIRSQKRET